MTPRAQVVRALKSPSCTSCNIKFENMERLNVHMRVKHQETDDSRLNRLTQIMHGSMTRVPSIEIILKSFDCTECGVTFVNESEMKIHNDKHHNDEHDLLRGIKTEECESDIKVSKTNSVMEMCEICDEFFNGSRSLRDHQNEYHSENGDRDKFEEYVIEEYPEKKVNASSIYGEDKDTGYQGIKMTGSSRTYKNACNEIRSQFKRGYSLRIPMVE